MTGLWRNNPNTPEGKYLVKRRDGSIPDWPWFVLGAKDPAAPAALDAYAWAAEINRMDPDYVADIRRMRDEWREYRRLHGIGKPDAPPELQDDPATIQAMRFGKSAQSRQEQCGDVDHIDLEEAETRISNATYQASLLFEHLECVGKVRGNGHHLAQAVAEFAQKLMRERWASISES